MGGQSVYDDMREHNEEVKWGKLVWYSQCIPKHSFILWMAVQRRLLTHDRMKCWGCYDMMVYGLCMMGEESHDYLFFQCVYSKAIWLNLQGKMNCTIHAQSWKDIVDIIAEKPCLNEVLYDNRITALAHVTSLGINYGVERGLRMGRTGAKFEVAAQKVSNFHIGAKADFDKAFVDFPTTPFPFLGKIVAVAKGTLPEVTQVLTDKHIRSVTSVPVAPLIGNEDANQVPLEHAC
ncbi:gypsy type transposase [Tanacetum coccineum]